MDRVDVAFIRALESDDTFFGMVAQLSVQENISLRKSYERFEAAREKVGLRRRFKGYLTFLTMRRRFKGETRTFYYKRYGV